MVGMLVLSFVAGAIGAMIGGTQAFVIYGIMGLVSVVLQVAGTDMNFVNNYVMNVFFLPAVFFGGAVPATAYAAKKSRERTEHRRNAFLNGTLSRDTDAPINRVTNQIVSYVIKSGSTSIRGMEIARPLAFTRDPVVLLLGGVGGVLGYIIFYLAMTFGLPADCGAFSIIVTGILFRLVFAPADKRMNKEGLGRLKNTSNSAWLYEVLFAIIVSLATGFFVYTTSIAAIAFYVSAALLAFQFMDPTFPVSHNITMAAGYAMFYTGNVILTVMIGVVAHMIMIAFAQIFNVDCETHIDPPAVAIFLCSLVVFLIWR